MALWESMDAHCTVSPVGFGRKKMGRAIGWGETKSVGAWEINQ